MGRGIELEVQAAREGFSPLDPFEWLPLIEGDARTGDTAGLLGQPGRRP